MNRHSSRILPVLALAALLVRIAPADGLRVESTTRPFEWTLRQGTNPVLVYAFDPSKPKPYVKELRTITGQNVLRDSPHDHLHHHALMYGIKVNGVNFWEEAPGCGVQRPVQSPPPETRTNAAGLPQARITQVIHWVTAEDAFLADTTRVALLVERRTLTLTIDESGGEVSLAWDSQFEVGHKTNTVTLTGANYHGLGARFLAELDPLAAHSLAGRTPDLTNNRQEVSPAAWAAVAFAAPGHPSMFLMAGHPANARGDALFFSMKTPFAYLSATQGLDREPLVYQAGGRFELKFLVALYPDVKTAAALEHRVQQWRATKL